MKSILDVISVRRMLSCQMDKSLILMIWENLKMISSQMHKL